MLSTIQNSYLKVGIKQKGAELASIINLATNQEYMWEANPTYWGRHSSILFPIVGRLKDDQIQIEDSFYIMKQHGFARNTDFSLSKQTANSITFELENTAEDSIYFPYQCRLQAKYHLEEKTLFVTYRIFNQDTKSIYFSIGAHPAFKCPLHENEVRSDYQLVFEKEETAHRQLLENGLRTGKTALVLNKEKILSITDDLFDQDALIFKDLDSDFVVLERKNGQKILKFGFKNFPYLGIWSKNTASPFICLEPWYGVADRVDQKGIFKNKEGVMELAVDEIFECVHSIEIM